MDIPLPGRSREVVSSSLHQISKPLVKASPKVLVRGNTSSTTFTFPATFTSRAALTSFFGVQKVCMVQSKTALFKYTTTSEKKQYIDYDTNGPTMSAIRRVYLRSNVSPGPPRLYLQAMLYVNVLSDTRCFSVPNRLSLSYGKV